MRHGEAALKENDPEQGLTHAGKHAIEQLANKLILTQRMNLEQVFHSEKTRTQQTAEIMTSIISPRITPLCRQNLKPNDNPENLLSDIETWTKETLITSHLPFIPTLLQLLTKDQNSVSFNPGTIVCLSKKDTSWHLEWVARPE